MSNSVLSQLILYALCGSILAHSLPCHSLRMEQVLRQVHVVLAAPSLSVPLHCVCFSVQSVGAETASASCLHSNLERMRRSVALEGKPQQRNGKGRGGGGGGWGNEGPPWQLEKPSELLAERGQRAASPVRPRRPRELRTL